MPSDLVFKEDGQEYAQVIRMVGNGEYEATCFDGTKQRLCHVRGEMHKKVWIEAGDIILVRLRDYQDGEADAILKYMPNGVRLLKAYGELPQNTRLLLLPLNEQGIAAAAAGLDEDEYYIKLEDEDEEEEEEDILDII